MKRNKVRNWIYAILKLLPLFILPILGLAIRSDNNFAQVSIDYSLNEIVNFNQLVNHDEYFKVSCSSGGQIYSGNAFGPSFTFNQDDFIFISFYQSTDISITSNDRFMVLVGNSGLNSSFSRVDGDISLYNPSSSTSGTHNFIGKVSDGTFINKSIGFWINNPNVDVYISNLQIFNLTLMFGVGNEPNTVTEFRNFYSDRFYPYNSGTIELLKDVSVVNYDNTDVGSQMIYSIYQPIHDYFNFKDYFGLNGVYDFMQLNMFNGNAPLPFFIAFNIIAYNLIIDLLLLVYSAIVFIIDFVFKCLDKFYGRSD